MDIQQAVSGGNGAKKRRQGKTGEDIVLQVPTGTIVKQLVLPGEGDLFEGFNVQETATGYRFSLQPDEPKEKKPDEKPKKKVPKQP